MEISPATTATPTATQKAQGTLTDTFDSFLLLLTTQLQNQDPLDPLSPNEFTAQLVQFTGVEQSIATNTNLEKLLSLIQGNSLTNAVQYIGKLVEVDGSTTKLENGQAEWSYTHDETVRSSTITVTDEAGAVVFTTPGKTAAGSHGFVWDGRDASGKTLPDAPYSVRVTALDSEGEPTSVATKTFGRVTAVESEAGDILLSVGGSLIPLANVFSVKEAKTG